MHYVKEWRRLIDSKIFFWAQKKSCDGLLNARLYRKQIHTIIEVRSRKFLSAFSSSIEIADINTGSVIHTPARRGSATFQSLEAYSRTKKRQIVEVTIPDRIPDIVNFVKRVTHRHPNGQEELLY